MNNCGHCSAENPAAAKFCNQCGKALGQAAQAPQRNYTPPHLAEQVLKHRAALEGERKRVTVLFADIKGSTALAEQAGAEAWHAILDRFFSLLSSAVHRYEGTVNQYTGDGIMALFGAPVAHEDHAQRAAHAALEMSAKLREFADELRLREGLNLSLRIGLNTGEVIVGRIGDDLRMDYTAQGMTVNLAARMEQICEPGRIYLTRNTERQIEGYFSLRALGDMAVDGAAEPLPVFELVGEGDLQTRLARQLARGQTRFIGRERETEQLGAALQRASAGDGQVVAVIGHAGIGKSRLCHEFTNACEDQNVEVYRATGVPYARAVPLFPVQRLIRARLGVTDQTSPEALRRLVAGTFVLRDAGHANLLPAVLAYLGAGSEAAEAGAELQDQVVELLVRWLVDSEQGQVLLIEDLHFLDPASEQFVEQLCKAVAGSRSLLLLNYRPDYLSEDLLPLIDEQISVSALGEAEIRRLMTEALGPDSELAPLIEQICERARGNPFYAEEAVHSLLDEGVIGGDCGAYKLLKPIANWVVPDTVHALIAARIDRLEERPRELLHTAAVVGQQFQVSLLAEVLEQGSAAAGQLPISALEEGGYVHRPSLEQPDYYAFCHPLVQEVAYETQLKGRRQNIHRRLAQLLSAQVPLETANCELAIKIAHHFERAGDLAEAGRWNLQAARGLGSQDMTVCLEQFQAAVRNLDAVPESREIIRQRVVARAGIIRMAQFTELDTATTERVFSEAQQMADKLDDLPTRAELLISATQELLHRGRSEEAARLSSRATDLCVESGAGELVNRFRMAILISHNAAGQPQAGIDCANRGAGSQWLETPINEENFLSRGFYGAMLMWLGRLEEAEQQMRAALSYAAKEDRASSWMYANLVDLAWFKGTPEHVLEYGRYAVERAMAFGSPFFRAIALRAHGLAQLMSGDPQRALDAVAASLPMVEFGANAYQLQANHLAVHSEALAAVGRYPEALAAAQAGTTSGQASGSKVWEMRAWVALLSLPQELVGATAAAAGLQRLEQLIGESQAKGLQPWCTALRARWASDADECQRLQTQAVTEFEAVGAHGRARQLRNDGQLWPAGKL